MALDQFKADYEKAIDLRKTIEAENQKRKNAESSGKSTAKVLENVPSSLIVRLFPSWPTRDAQSANSRTGKDCDSWRGHGNVKLSIDSYVDHRKRRRNGKAKSQNCVLNSIS